MRTTYEKVSNTIIVELSLEEVQEYLATELSAGNENLRKIEDHWELTIVCGSSFYEQTQRRKGGVQNWSPDELRSAIRAAVANRLVKWEPEFITPENFKVYKTAWSDVYQSLLRNVRLKFPSPKHPRERMSRQDWLFKKKWRAQFVK